ncbi:E3 ubiquitin-protein ligase TRIM36 isoform X8 [Equus przewalskii]|uniref:E3 ubiquitin-protein ligase TRIM36 isoform X8 n=1 Tax=Equus przewalskii TaxID=9798 RepID=A0ABM4KBR7_EQUPR|nr:E3 ubiquitin-protein ligase TRIM36 isoform X5 [Equus caballus]
MSESGEISEFGYIMELLARGKASAMGLAQTREHSQLTSQVREPGVLMKSQVGKQALTIRTQGGSLCALFWRGWGGGR